MRKRGFYEKYIKRLQDLILALLALIILSPLYILLGCLIRIKLGSPILFTQDRPGKDEKVFKLYKFRTMTNGRDEFGELLPDEVRLTKFGKFLRSTSLDELPELWNILRGDMAIIGPRPLLVQYLPLYNSEQKRRHEVRPGLSGYAQVKGRNSVSWEERFKWDVEYINNINFVRDWKIFFATIKKVLIREGINSETSATMEVFTGTPSERAENE